MLIQLPNGLIDGQDHFNFAEVDELRGKQQNYLSDRELVDGNIGHLPKILEDMVLSLQTKEGLQWKGKIADAIEKLPSGDLETLLIKIRENTYGERFYHEATCPHCNHHHKNLKLELNTLQLDVMPVQEMLNPKILKLPKCGKEVELKPVYLKDLFTVVKMTKGKQDKLVTTLLAVTIKRIGDITKVTEKEVEDIPAQDILYLKEQVENMKLEGSIDTDITIDCNGCGKEFTVKMNCYDPNFFDPTRGSMSLNI